MKFSHFLKKSNHKYGTVSQVVLTILNIIGKLLSFLSEGKSNVRNQVQRELDVSVGVTKDDDGITKSQFYK